MLVPSGRSVMRKGLPLGVLLLSAAVLAGCNSTGESSGSSGNAVTNAVFGASNPAQQNAIVVSAETFGFDVNDCPPVSIRPGTEAITQVVPGEKINPELGQKPTIQYQASITNTARECTKAASGVNVKLGVKGRVVGGAGAKAGAITLPLRVVVMKGTDEVVTSTLYKVSVTLQEPNYAADFTKIDDTIVLPIAPGNTDYRIFVGFDEGSLKSKKK